MFMSMGCKTSHSTLDGVKWGHLEALQGEDTKVSNYTVVHPEIGENAEADPGFLGGGAKTREGARTYYFCNFFAEKLHVNKYVFQ